IVADLTHLARKHPDISQRSGVSVRVSVSNYENLLSNAVKRAIRLNERQAAPRVSALEALVTSTAGKIEIEAVGDAREDKVLTKLLQGAVSAVFNRHFSVHDFDELLTRFHNGMQLEVSDNMPAMEYIHQVSEIKA